MRYLAQRLTSCRHLFSKCVYYFNSTQQHCQIGRCKKLSTTVAGPSKLWFPGYQVRPWGDRSKYLYL